MKAVIDTNVWLDWLVFDDPAARPIAAAAGLGRLRLLATRASRAELASVLARPIFGLDAAATAAALHRHDAHVRLVDPPPDADTLPARLPLCRDPDDQKFVELAIAARANFLVSRDKALLKLARPARRWHGLAIVHPESPSWQETLAAAAAAATTNPIIALSTTGPFR
ncbi:MAG: putative toxin-antitoxin system toxin component, PIN family [Burkholderiaceae bacterium]